jgi:hypothetical protein
LVDSIGDLISEKKIERQLWEYDLLEKSEDEFESHEGLLVRVNTIRKNKHVSISSANVGSNLI